jgi:cytochrome d ubiquinol oxidase subunit I
MVNRRDAQARLGDRRRSSAAPTIPPTLQRTRRAMDVEMLSRLQFAITIGFHFLFPPISIGLAWLLVIVEAIALKTGDVAWEQAGRFFAKLLGLTFAVGVATGIVMEFQFGTNWAEYSRYVGDIFGAPLAAEAVIAFFLESSFLGLYLLGRNKIGKPLIVFSILMVAIGATISAFWILVANSWQQTPAGFIINEQLGRAELTSFAEAVFNPSMWHRFFHTMLASFICGAFFMMGVCAMLLRKNPEHGPARKALKTAVILGFFSAILAAFPSGHEHAQQVARDQPAKFAAIEGLYTTQKGAPLLAFGLVQDQPPELKAEVQVPIPGLLSWMAFGDPDAEIKGIDAFPEDERPPLWLTFVSFHNMVILGSWFVLITFICLVQLWRGKLWSSRKILMLLVISIPLPLAACQFGWVAAEVGRQPWIVYGHLRTSEAFSATVSAGEVWFSLILLTCIYTMLLALYLFLLGKEVTHGHALAAAKEAE